MKYGEKPDHFAEISVKVLDSLEMDPDPLEPLRPAAMPLLIPNDTMPTVG